MRVPTLSLAILLALTCSARADMKAGTRVPTPTAANQHLTSAAAGGTFAWAISPVLDYQYDGAGHTTFGGGTLGTSSVLTANVVNTGDNGFTVNMPNGGTGYAFTTNGKVSIGGILSLPGAGGLHFDTNNSPGFTSIACPNTLEIQGSQEGATGTLRLGNPTGGLFFGGVIASGYGINFSGNMWAHTRAAVAYGSYDIDTIRDDGSFSLGEPTGLGSTPPTLAMLTVSNSGFGFPTIVTKLSSGQTADAEQLLTSTGTILKHTTAAGKTYAQGYGVRSGTTDTDGYTGNIPSTAQSTHVKGGIIIGFTDSTGATVGN